MYRGNIIGTPQQQQQPRPPQPSATASARKGAAATATNASPAVDKFERFENWLRENGAKFELLELREYNSCGSSATTGGTNDNGSNGLLLTKNDEEKKEPPLDDDIIMYGGSGVAGNSNNSSGSCGDNNATADEDSEMRGVHARMHVPPNTICMSVPRRCLITVEMGQATPIGQAILHSDLDLDAPKHIFLMIYILWDRKVNGSNSFFHPYYEILPPTLRNMPIFWNAEEMAQLDGSYLLQQIRDRNMAITDDYYSICQICSSFQQIASLDEFKWARMCVCSRNFGLQMDGHRTSALVPHADMLNHYRPRETKWTFDEDKQAFTITSLQHIPAGAQVYDSYGQKCNHRFLLNYGFAVEDNRELDGFCPNEVPLELYVDPNTNNGDCSDSNNNDNDEELFAAKLEYWTRGEGSSNSNSAASSTNVGSLLQNSGFLPTAAASSGGSHYSHFNHNNTNNSSMQTSTSHPQPPPQPAPVVKRVRVCASNNENTRLLFSLLRALACNREDLISIGAMTTILPTQHQQQQQQPENQQHQHQLYNHHHQYNNNNNIPTAPSSSLSSSSSSSRGTSSKRTTTISGNNMMGAHAAGAGAAVARSLLGFSNLSTATTNMAATTSMQQQQQHQPNQHPYNSGMSSSFSNMSSRQPNNHQHNNNNNPGGGGASLIQHHPPSSSSLSAAAIAATAGSAMAAASAASYHYRSCRDIRHPLSLRNERAAMHLLIKVVQRHLLNYPTTLNQDIADLMDEQSFPRFSNMRHAKIQVRGEKEVLHHFMLWARTALDVLDIIEEELKDEQRTSGAVEVQLNPQTGGACVVTTKDGSDHSRGERLGFEYIIRRMEDDIDNGVHHTILRYCADVLGSLRREEFKNLRRSQQLQQQQSHHRTTTTSASASTTMNQQQDPSVAHSSSKGVYSSHHHNNHNNNSSSSSSNNNSYHRSVGRGGTGYL